MEIARQQIAQAWCTDKNKHKEMDTDLAEACAEILASWLDIAATHHKNEQYYRGLLDQCAKHIGAPAYIQDDGGRSESPLRAKTPELVESAICALYQLAGRRATESLLLQLTTKKASVMESMMSDATAKGGHPEGAPEQATDGQAQTEQLGSDYSMATAPFPTPEPVIPETHLKGLRSAIAHEHMRKEQSPLKFSPFDPFYKIYDAVHLMKASPKLSREYSLALTKAEESLHWLRQHGETRH